MSNNKNNIVIKIKGNIKVIVYNDNKDNKVRSEWYELEYKKSNEYEELLNDNTIYKIR